MDADALNATRRALHGVAELVLAGPQYRASGTIRLRPSPGGFATVKEPSLRVDVDELVTVTGRVGLTGITIRELAAAAGIEPCAPEGLYADGSGVTLDEPLHVDPAAARTIARAYAAGDEALRALAPGEVPVLWPEHFDLGISLDEVNYGVSPGDATLPEPYAYAGPWEQRTGPFWNVSFGAARPFSELPDTGAVLAFFTEARRQAHPEH
jgi:hypothetical protein